MRRLLAALILAPAIVGAQNLVTNATMEETRTAAFRPRIEKAVGWSNSNEGTADLFIRRDIPSLTGIPDNFMGTQECVDCNYAGIIAFYGDQRISISRSITSGDLIEETGYGRYTEYVQGEFKDPLKAGQVYNFSFVVSLAEESDRAIRGLGAHVSKDKKSATTNSYLNIQPQVISERVISDMQGWTEISGTFVAAGGERYVTIGAFPAYLGVADISSPNDNDSRKAYYYIAKPTLIVRGTPETKLITALRQTEMFSAATALGVQGSAFFLMLNFAPGAAEFRPGDYEKLDAVARYMIEYPETDVKVEGHADGVDTSAENREVSARRAYKVRHYLISKGVQPGQIETVPYGTADPLSHTAYADPRNRRIELYRVE